MNKKIVFSIVLFISTFGLFAKEEPKYTSSTITKACKDAGHSGCKEKATQTKEFIFAFKKAYKSSNKNLDSKELYKKCIEFATKKVSK